MALLRILAASAAAALLAGCASVPLEPDHSMPNQPGAGMPSACQPVIAPDLPVASTSPVDMPPPIIAVSRQPAVAPAVAPLPVPAPAPVASLTPKPGFYVQLGAFGNADTAAGIRTRLVQAGGALRSVEVVAGGALHRVFSGPFATREAALLAAREVPEALRLKPIVIKR